MKTLNILSIDEHIQNAKNGNADSQFFLYNIYSDGRRVVQDDKTALKWCIKSANNGCAKAQNELGHIYSVGNDYIKKNYLKAIKWYTKASEQNCIEAHFNLGIIYMCNEYENHEKAIKHFENVIENSENIIAQYCLGILYIQNKHLGHNDNNGYNLIKNAAKKGYKYAQIEMAILHLNKDKKTFGWYMAAAKQEHANAQYNIGVFYVHGIYVKPDYKKAIKWLTLAAEKDYVDAQFSLGVLYYQCTYVKNYSLAVKWFTNAVDNGCLKSKKYLKEIQKKYH